MTKRSGTHSNAGEPSSSKSAQIERGPRSFEDYLCLEDAAQLIGSRLVSEWRKADLDDWLNTEGNPEARERAGFARDRLHRFLAGGRVRAFGHNHEGAYFEIGRERLSAPFFELDLQRSRFLWTPEDWDTIFVSKIDLEQHIDSLQPSKARKAATFDWREITSTAWMLALEDINLRTQARLIDAIQNDYAAKHDQHPDDKELRGLVLTIIEHLGYRMLSREVSQSESSSDAPNDSA